MTDCVNERQFSAAVIKYLLAMGELCDKNGKARSVDIAARINVSKPSAHSMINNLCAAGLAKKERYGAVYLTEEGKAAAARYGKCYAPLHRRMKELLGFDGEACQNAACEILAKVPEQLESIAKRLE